MQTLEFGTSDLLQFDKVIHQVIHSLLLNLALKSARFRRVSSTNEHFAAICAIGLPQPAIIDDTVSSI